MSDKPDEQNQSQDETDPSSKDSSLEELAGELLGVNLNSTSKSSDDVSLDDLDWGELEFAPSAAPAIDDPEGDGSNESTTDVETIASNDEDVPNENENFEFDEAKLPSNVENDPLAAWDNSVDDWNWDEKKSESSHPPESRDEMPADILDISEESVDLAASETSSSSLSSIDEDPETAEDFVSEYNDDDHFGLGLFAENRDEKLKSSGKSQKKTSSEEKTRELEAIDLDRLEPDEPAESEVHLDEATDDFEEDDFGADLDLDDEKTRPKRKKKTATAKKKSDRDRTKSVQRKPTDRQRSSGKETAKEEPKETHRKHKDSTEVESKSPSSAKSDYRTIPTWDEAISFLLNPGLVNTEKDEGSANGKRSRTQKIKKEASGTKTAPRKRKRRR